MCSDMTVPEVALLNQLCMKIQKTCCLQDSAGGTTAYPVTVYKSKITKPKTKGFPSCPGAPLSLLPSLFPFFCLFPFAPFFFWICPPFRWLVAMLLLSMSSLALWWIVYGFPSPFLHFCIDGG